MRGLAKGLGVQQAEWDGGGKIYQGCRIDMTHGWEGGVPPPSANLHFHPSPHQDLIAWFQKW